MRIAICEDRKTDAQRLTAALNHYLEVHRFSVDMDYFEDGEAFMRSFEQGKYQIVFMDIFMAENGLTGMEAAERIREVDKEVAVILTTTSEDYILAGYDVAVYYIVKPVTEQALEKAMERCYSQIERYSSSIEITVNRKQRTLRLHHILYVEALQRSCIFVTLQGELKSNMLFETLAETLTELPFLRCHRSYLVNLAHVQNMEGRDFILPSGIKVPISRPALPEVEQKFQQFLSRELRGQLD